MTIVKTVQDSGDTAALIFLEGEPKGIWTPDRELARTLLGKPIPSDWLVKPNKQGTGNIALPPKKGGGGGGYRQSKEAFESEAKSRAAWQAIEEERRDRRTALMQAVAILDKDSEVVAVAEYFYDWLRETSGSVAGESPNPPVEKPALDLVPDPSPPTAIGDTAKTPSVQGEVAAGPEPGGQSNPPGSTKTYPMSPEQCDHRARGGYWLKTQVVDGQARCPRCGLSAVVYRETA